MNVKRKGTAGENELAELLRQSGIRAYRNDQIYTGGRENPDVQAEISGLPLHIEVKRVERLNVPEAMSQAIGGRFSRLSTQAEPGEMAGHNAVIAFDRAFEKGRNHQQ